MFTLEGNGKKKKKKWQKKKKKKWQKKKKKKKRTINFSVKYIGSITIEII